MDFICTHQKKKIQKAVTTTIFVITNVVEFMTKYIVAVSHFALIHWLSAQKELSNARQGIPCQYSESRFTHSVYASPGILWKAIKLSTGYALASFLKAASLFLELCSHGFQWVPCDVTSLEIRTEDCQMTTVGTRDNWWVHYSSKVLVHSMCNAKLIQLERPSKFRVHKHFKIKHKLALNNM